MEKKNDNKVVIIIMSIVILVLVGAIVYMFVNGNVTNNNTSNNKDTEEKDDGQNNVQEADKETSNNDNEPKQLSLEDPLVEKLYNYVTIKLDFNETVDLFGTYGTVTNKDISNEMKLKIALTVDKLGDDFKFLETRQGFWGPVNVYGIDSSIVLNKINEIFGENNGYTHIDKETMFPVLANAEPVCASLSYNVSTNMYEREEAPGCGGMVTHFVHTKLVSAEKNDDTIVLTQKIYMISGGKAYKTLDARDVIDENCGQNCINDSYFEKGATTKYTFKLAKDGSYYFDSKITY